MRPSTCAAALAMCSAVSPGQTDGSAVRVRIDYLVRAENQEHMPRLLPSRDAGPMSALGPRNPGRIDRGRLVDMIAEEVHRQSGRTPSVSFDADSVLTTCEGVDKALIYACVGRTLENFIPPVNLSVAVYAGVANPVPPMLSPEDESVIRRERAASAVHSRTIRCGANLAATVQLGDGPSSRLRLRLLPHLLTGQPARIALLCEFECEHADEDGNRRWAAGTASAVVPVGGRMVLSLPGRTVAIGAKHVPRAPGDSRVIGVPYSLLSSPILRAEPHLAKLGPARIEYARLPVAANDDLLTAFLRSTTMEGSWDRGDVLVDPSHALLVVGRDRDLVSRATREIGNAVRGLAAPWTETAAIDCGFEADGGRVVTARVPTIPGRACILFCKELGPHASGGVVFGVHWYPDTRLLKVPEPFADLRSRGHGQVTGFVASLPGRSLEPSAPDRIERASPLGKGRTSLIEAQGVRLAVTR